MTGLAQHHVARPRLTDVLEGTRVGVVEAGSGFGKTSLAFEFARTLDAPSPRAALDANQSGPDDLVSALRLGFHRAGLDALALRLEVSDREPREALEALLADLARHRTPLLAIVDDTQHLPEAGDATALLLFLCENIPEPHRVLVMGRRIPGHLSNTLRGSSIHLTGDELALRADEVDALCRNGFGVELSGRDADHLHKVTAGWPAAVVLAAAGLAKTADASSAIAAAARSPKLISHLVEDVLSGFQPDDLAAVTQMAHLPLIGPAIGHSVGSPGLYERTLDAGLPYGAIRDGWRELAGPVRDHLTSLGALDVEIARRAASIYERRDESQAAISVLLAAGDDDRAAAMVASWPAAKVSHLDPREIRRLIGWLPPAVIENHPRVLLHLGRAHDAASAFDACRAAFQQGRSLIHAGSPRAMREFDAELARDLARHAEIEEAGRLAQDVLTAASGNEKEARSRAHGTLGRVAAVTGEGPGSARQAERHFEEAARLAVEAGMPEWAANDLTALAFYVHSERGHDYAAISALDRAVGLVPAPGPTRANALSFRAITLQYLGRFDEAQADLDESRAIAEVFGDDRLQAYAHWQGALGAARRGSAEETRRGLQMADRMRGAWYEHPTGLEFLAEAAECADLIGDFGLCARYVERARSRIAERAEPSAGFAETLLALIDARSGDPAAALVALETLDPEELPERERWRATLLRSYAAFRLGDPQAAGLAAHGFDMADAMGNPGLPFAQERAVAEALVALAAEAGSIAAAERAVADLPTRISVLGRFEVSRGGQSLDLPKGRPNQIVKVLACARGRMPTEALMEAIWSDGEPASARKALRNGLNRLRAAAGDLVIRDGDMLTFGERVTVDAAVFEDLSGRAASARGAGGVASAGLATRALAHYRGDLLPDDPYEPWAAERRERLRLLRLRLLDLLAAVAEERGDVVEAAARLDDAIGVSPYDEHRYVAAARLLAAAGHYGEAASVARRGAAAMAELEVAPSPELAEILQRLAAAAS